MCCPGKKTKPGSTHWREGMCVCLSECFCTFVCAYVFVFRNIFVLNSHCCISSLLQKDFDHTRITNLSCPGVEWGQFLMSHGNGHISWTVRPTLLQKVSNRSSLLPQPEKNLRWSISCPRNTGQPEAPVLRGSETTFGVRAWKWLSRRKFDR